jgi:hypothetical protein
MRIDDKFILSVAKSLLSSSTANAWPYVSDEIREALLDRAVMDCIRLSNSDNPISPDQLCNFRNTLQKVLEDGVFIGKSKRGLMLDSVREERRINRLKETP